MLLASYTCRCPQRIKAVGFTRIAALHGLAAVGVLVMAGLQVHHEIYPTGKCE
ncbi:MAG: hypothetical protein MUE45_01480 [Methanoregulaceae archaeon]|nr:hypothetical protein [Methanoregulaceae archaeon]